MKTIEIVSHCQAVQNPWYASLLNYQLSSLFLYPSKNCKILVTICCNREDVRTNRVLNFYKPKLDLNIIYQPFPELGRRSIGRDLVARRTEADIVWFTDVDFLFRDSCLQTLVEHPWSGCVEGLPHKDSPAIVYPSVIQAQRLEQGLKLSPDKLLIGLVDIDEKEFEPLEFDRPTGALQIIKGPLVREWGYCRDNHHELPEDGSFDRCLGDPTFRRMYRNKGHWKPIDLQGVYRLRHPLREGHRLKKIEEKRLRRQKLRENNG